MQKNQLQILLLCENDNAAHIDRRLLREAGYAKVKVMTSGIAAARLIAGLDQVEDGLNPDIIVSSQKLGDMTGEQFCAIIRQHPRLLDFPVLLIMPNDSEAEQLKTLGCGASALLGRPYSMDALKKQLDALAASASRLEKLHTAAAQPDTRAFDEALASFGILLQPDREPEDYFKVGMRCLHEKRWNYAISAFQLALGNAQTKAEAELGIAAAFKGKGNMPRFQDWLAKAIDTLVRARRWHMARTAYARLLQHDADAKNPFLAEAHRLIKHKSYEEAAEALSQSLALIPKAQTGNSFARICLAADNPEAMFKALEASLTRENGEHGDVLSHEIHQRLDVMAKQKRERDRQLAAERKWQLARKMNAAKKPAAEEKTAPQPVMESTGGLTLANIEEGQEISLSVEHPFAETDTGEKQPILEPLARHEATSGLFTKKPRLNEFLSVMKLTWKLAKRSRKD